MHRYEAKIRWQRNGAAFTDQRYGRGHEWQFDGGTTVRASASPAHVPLPMSEAAAVDPEEAIVAAASSCHMLFFLYFAARRGHVVESYEDDAYGVMGKRADGKVAFERIALRPRIAFAGEAPGADALAALHHEAHEACYVASSLRAPIEVENG
jgi:organic hydroperoxide reductase OsmC/OhrA